ncbi:MAG: hypothetical protein ABI002_09735 [Saprospiraceae bacterium]
MKMSEIKKVRTTWIYNNGGYVYDAPPESLVANDSLKTIRFELREIDGQDDNLEVVIQTTGNSFTFKTDYYGNPLEELSLEKFTSDEGMILFYEGKHGVAYFHLEF